MTIFSKIVLKKRTAYLIGAVLYLIGIVLYFFYNYNESKKNDIQKIDIKLRAGALGVSYILGEDFPDKIKDKDSISHDEYIECVKKLSKYSDEEGLKYVYTMEKDGDKIVFTSTSATKEELEKNSYSDFFEVYEDASPKLLKSFENKKEFFEVAADKWGNFRSILIPKISPKGKTYIVGADITVKDINNIFRKSFINSLVVAVYFFVIIIPLILIYYIYTKKDEEEIIESVYTDRMTELPNREKLLLDILEMETPVVFLININAFKEINDFYGHHIGDSVIIEMAWRLKFVETRDKFELYKMTADEFALVYNKEMTDDEMETLARYFFEVISESVFECENNEINIIATVGVAKYIYYENEEKEYSYQKTILNADMALKKAKEIKKHFIVYKESMNISKEYEQNVLWRKKLLDAIKEDRMEAFFQPIINNKTHKVEKYETLIRLIDIGGEIIGPYKFLEVSKKARIYHYITRVIVSKSFEMFDKNDIEFSINLSVDDINDDLTAGFILQKLGSYRNPKRVVFEILESDGIENYEGVSEFIKKVKASGAKIAIDDFGSGYSNFMHIMKLDVDYIKIDASIIKNIDKDKNSEIITQTISEFSKKLGIKTIAEFVHSKEVYDKVVELNIDFSQGYYFGEPRAYLLEEKNEENNEKEEVETL